MNVENILTFVSSRASQRALREYCATCLSRLRGSYSAENLSMRVPSPLARRLDSSGFTRRLSVPNRPRVALNPWSAALVAALAVCPLQSISAGESVAPFIDLGTLDGDTGFALNGVDADDVSGYTVRAAGDVNGDGTGDIIIGAPDASPGGRTKAGRAWVVYGDENGFEASLELADLDGTNGFAMNGVDIDDNAGTSVSNAGDVNADGYDDVLVGAPQFGGGPGFAYVVFGGMQFPAELELANLDGANGFAITGNDASVVELGIAVSDAGDVNGDGIDDILVAQPFLTLAGENAEGKNVYVILGRSAGFPATVDVDGLDGDDGFVISGIDSFFLGRFVSGAGDLNGDGVDDIVVGAMLASAEGRDTAGEVYVIFGSEDKFPSLVDVGTLNGRNGFTLSGAATGDNLGFAVAGAGDANRDGVDDLIIGAPALFAPAGAAGSAYVIYGSRGRGRFKARLDLAGLKRSQGYVIHGIAEGDLAGWGVDRAGDFNGDKIGDVIIGAIGAPGGGEVGEAYVVFGKQGRSANLEAATLAGVRGTTLVGIATGNVTGFSVGPAGELDDDDRAGVIVGATGAAPNGKLRAGQTYVVFGNGDDD